MQITIEKQKLEPALYIVSTPIGNLKDISLRALETLMSADFVACEDTRVTGVLLTKFGFKAQYLVYTDHADEAKRERIYSEIQAGKSIALVSDAGTPLISDPGYKLVADAIEAGIKVISIPGACAAIAGLSISGMATDKFYFAGFLPKKSGAAKDFLNEIAKLKASLIFYERGTRVKDLLEKVIEVLGDRKVALTREITKKFEEVTSAKASELLGLNFEERGEFVVIVEGADEKCEVKVSDEELQNFLNENRQKYKPKVLAEIAADKYRLSKKEVYDRLIKN